MKKIFFLLLSALSLQLAAQPVEKIFLDKAANDRNCYTAILPDSEAAAILFLVPGFGENPVDVLTQTTLPLDAANAGILTVIPTFQNGVESFGFDPDSQMSFRQIVEDATERYGMQGKPYFVGGFSMGGCAAVRFAEEAERKPAAIFAIDSPLDIERFYYATLRDAAHFGKDDGSPDNIYRRLLNDIEAMTGGSPLTASENFRRISPYSMADPEQTAILPLTDIPVRIYIEPDIEWWLNERNTDAYGLNIIDCSGFVNDLRRIGNVNAELIITQGAGYREPGHTRHPHSWSIADKASLIGWLLSCAKIPTPASGDARKRKVVHY